MTSALVAGYASREARCDRVGLRLRLRGSRARRESSDEAKNPQCAVLALLRTTVHRERHRRPQLELARGKLEGGRHHADDEASAPIELDGAPDNRAVAAEPPLPQPMAEDDMERRAVFARKRTADERRNAEGVEEVRRHRRPEHLLGLARSGQRLHVRRPHAGLRERRHARLLVGVVGQRHARGDQTVGVGVRKRDQQNPAHEAEHRGRGADAERNRQQRHRGKPGGRAQLPQREQHILAKLVEILRTAHVFVSLMTKGPAVATHPLDVAELGARPGPRRVTRQPLRLVVARPHLEMERHFIVHLVAHAEAEQPRALPAIEDRLPASGCRLPRIDDRRSSLPIAHPDASRIFETPAENCAHCAVWARSCRRPSGVSR